ncbi:MAG: outer membrane lipoprotein chaperone LolA [Pseudomonadota bacterium]
MKNRLFFILLNIFLLQALYANADGDTDELVRLLKNYESLSGDFSQSLVNEKGEQLQNSSGAFLLKKPGFFYWDTQAPFPQLVVSDLVNVWLYDPDLEQVTIRPYEQVIDQSPALLLSGNADKIKQNYTVNKLDKTPLAFELIPLASDSPFTHLQLQFNRGIIEQMQLRDSLEQTTTFSFSSVALNPKLDSKRFQFTPPEGVDVLVDQ